MIEQQVVIFTANVLILIMKALVLIGVIVAMLLFFIGIKKRVGTGRRSGLLIAFLPAIFLVLLVPGCSVSVAGRPIVTVDDGVASRTVGGATVGAAAGAAGGAVAGNAGKGAAIGAAAGGVIGLLSGILGGSSYGTMPCSRWPDGSAQRDACLRGYSSASIMEAERQGRCSGGDRSACYWWGGDYGYNGYSGWNSGWGGWSRHRRGWW